MDFRRRDVTASLLRNGTQTHRRHWRRVVTSDPHRNADENQMNFFLWLIFGGLVGWGSSLVRDSHRRQGIVINVAAGMAGAILGGWLLGRLIGHPSIDQDDFSLPGLLISLLGAFVLVAVVRLVRLMRGAATP
jgi:uncharacterized membrane protein YeaQ/YmgE (transglycosylase-associated protein family)